MTAAELFDLTGRVALVTGASSGLGARFAQVLAAAGAAVVLVARRADRLAAVKAQIEKAGGRAIAVGRMHSWASWAPATFLSWCLYRPAQYWSPKLDLISPEASAIASAAIEVESVRM